MVQAGKYRRRIVTGHTADGRSRVIQDGTTPRDFDFKHMPGMSNRLMWGTNADGAPIALCLDVPDINYIPEAGGTRMAIVTFPPDTIFEAPDFDPAAADEEQRALLPGLAELFESDAPGFHRTPTIDYGVVIEGSIELELDDGAPVKLGVGDVVVQNATRHAWRNKTSAPTVMAFVMIGMPTGAS